MESKWISCSTIQYRCSTGTLARATLKIYFKNPNLISISSKFLFNISTGTCICIRKNYKNGKFSLTKIPVPPVKCQTHLFFILF